MFEGPCIQHPDCLRELAWPQWDSVAAGETPVSWVWLQKFVRATYTIWNFRVFSIIRSLFDAIFSQDVAKEGG